MTERFKPKSAALVILKDGNSILLLRRYNTGWADGEYTLPSGHIDENESATIAAIRESKEEVDIDIAVVDMRFAHVLHRKNNTNGQTYIDFFFVATKWSGTPINNEPDKCDEIGWFDIDNLPDNVVPFVADVLRQYQASEVFSEIGWSDDK